MNVNRKRLWEGFKLRMSLFRIWFVKNIIVFLQVFLVTCLVLMFTGVITETTPFFGTLLYPIFSPLLDEINVIIKEKEITGVMSFLGVSLSILMSLCLFTAKTKTIAEKDIKSIKMKAALVKANLYFNTDGKLVKKLEKATNTDLDGDNDVSGEPHVTEGFFSGIKRAWEELLTILSVKFGEDETEVSDEDKYNAVLREANLEKTEEAIEEIKEIAKEGTNQIISDEVDKIVKEKSETMETEEGKEMVKHSGLSIKTIFGKLFAKKENDNAEIIENDDTDDVLENDIIDEEIKEEVKKESKSEKVTEIDVNVNLGAVKTSKQAFLDELRSRRKR